MQRMPSGAVHLVLLVLRRASALSEHADEKLWCRFQRDGRNGGQASQVQSMQPCSEQTRQVCSNRSRRAWRAR